ncbi:hypothetical protein F0562_001660 [Nyssa sinensis]|uniref:Uncharacterized protein n=1 Tax=Nyssa sinensis TaxID=561372 RepID=A0A5J5C3L9_9ASTE|nr:hypothetical protein F0562_001660 [Nyssa sinensis]
MSEIESLIRQEKSVYLLRIGHLRHFLFAEKLNFRGPNVLRAMASDSQNGKKRVEIVHDPDERLNNLANEVDKNAGLSRLTLFSPYKINVFLRRTRKREDGFHDLAYLFHVISLGDKIKFSLSSSKSKGRFSTNVPRVPLDDRNFIIKALNLYRKKTETDNFFWYLGRFILIKRCSLFFFHGGAYYTGRGESLLHLKCFHL